MASKTKRFTVTTMTGSKYFIRKTGQYFFLSADNVPNPESGKVTGEWEITQPTPWPPLVGRALIMFSAYHDEPLDHPLRMPGGGKWTSPVTSVDVS